MEFNVKLFYVVYENIYNIFFYVDVFFINYIKKFVHLNDNKVFLNVYHYFNINY